MALSHELYFLVSHPSSAVPAETALCRVKVSDTPVSDPVMAFTSEGLGNQLITGNRLEAYCSLLALSDMTPSQIHALKNQNVLLFAQSEQVAQYLQNREKFNFSSCILPFENIARANQNAL